MTRRPINPHVSPAPLEEDRRRDAVRAAFANWASGVAVLTARDDDGHLYAMTVAAVTPVSVDPPLILVCVHNDAPLASMLDEGVRCALSMLNEGQKRAATNFADRYTVPGDLLTDEHLPVVADSGATLVGAVEHVYDGGDHRIVVIAIDTAHVGTGDLPPLVYWTRTYRQLAPEEG